MAQDTETQLETTHQLSSLPPGPGRPSPQQGQRPEGGEVAWPLPDTSCTPSRHRHCHRHPVDHGEGARRTPAGRLRRVTKAPASACGGGQTGSPSHTRYVEPSDRRSTRLLQNTPTTRNTENARSPLTPPLWVCPLKRQALPGCTMTCACGVTRVHTRFLPKICCAHASLKTHRR